jgi:hypothetical protein
MTKNGFLSGGFVVILLRIVDETDYIASKTSVLEGCKRRRAELFPSGDTVNVEGDEMLWKMAVQ